MQRQRAGPGVADIDAVLGDDQLAVGVDRGDGARHERQVVDDGRAVREFLLEQLLADDVEPEQLAGRRIVGRPLAKLADHVGKDARACSCHAHPSAKTLVPGRDGRSARRRPRPRSCRACRGWSPGRRCARRSWHSRRNRPPKCRRPRRPTISFGSTAPIAAMPFGPSTLAGKNFSAEACALDRRKRLGRREHAGHGDHATSSAARASTAASTFGADQQPAAGRMPAARRRRRSSTVPAPTSAVAGRSATIVSIERNGSGELSGTSIASMPASNTARPTAFASCGAQPAQDGDDAALEFWPGRAHALALRPASSAKLRRAASSRPLRTAVSASTCVAR